jgi:hypothetical protein
VEIWNRICMQKKQRLSDALKRVTRWIGRTRFWYGVQEDSEREVLHWNCRRRGGRRGTWTRRCKCLFVASVFLRAPVEPLIMLALRLQIYKKSQA